MGNTCKPMAVSFQCMTKSTTNKKNKKKNKKEKQKKRSKGLLLRTMKFSKIERDDSCTTL